ncbi:TonB-dependent receptor domain-containing protein [Dyadobacter fermentans]|uniref:TonB-dependent receptor n=1 Tax=Dyadobacter fermentans (strain ATCC 700827 / DSM 18053 / CIP 107007 / KCTC 52180 / NS114) TaxID=471854 RepID=C6VRW9_DYAFD|nr:outer membrane beta-barrel family protein [Dyadobacter fermentans]ACT94490.1 TonB-dependent receptor [Dyadobacter fermentans DSM 18053]
MKLVLQLTFLAVFSGLTSEAFAQFPGGGGGGSRGGGGDFRGGGNRPQRQTVIPGTAEDTPKGNGKITGVLVDSTSKKPVEFAALSLVDTKTNSPIDGTTTDEKGEFTLTKVASGNFKILISFIGYKTKTISNVKIDRRTELNLGTVVLVPDVVQLNEVEVVGMAQMVEEKVDRLVYNAEKDITSRGGDASDVMKKVPMLTVDLDGNVSLRGSSNVRVLINNKPSTIIATSVADALKQIPADMIKSVEVITSPSARYDAEGSAGIINIITKKSTIQGGTLNLDTGIGNRGSNLGLRGNYRIGKMGFSLGGFGRFNYNMPGKSENLQVGKLSDFTVRQMSDSKNKMAFGSYNFGWDWEIDSKTSLSAGVRYGMRNNKVDQELYTYNTVNDTTRTSFRDVNSKDLSGTWDVNVDYMKTLAKPGQELSISTQYSRNNRTNDFDADIFSLNNTQLRELIGQQGNNNSSHNQESTVQVDYQTPIKENQMLELGGKGIFRQVVSNFDYYNTVDTPQPASNLNYDQNVAAGYLSYTFTTKSRFTVKAGTRYEYTSIDAQQGEAGDLRLPAYGNLVPSINLSQTFGKGQTVKLAYNRRLQRPGIQFLNPNRNAANPQNITEGNPNLKPELTDQVELGTSFFKNSMYINVSTFARFTNSSIESIRTTDENGVITTTYGNIGSKKNYGANIFGNVTFFKRWQLGGGFDFYYADLSNNSPDLALQNSNSGFVLSGRFRTSLNIKNGWGLQAGGFMRGRDVQLQGTQAGFRMYDFGIRKEFANKRGSIGFGMENFLAPSFKMKTSLESSTFTQNNTNYLYNRGFRVNFSYRFGKMTFVEQKPRRRKSVNNDDQKSDGGGNMDAGGGGMQGGGQAPAAAPAAGGRGAGAPGAGRPQGARPAADSTARPVQQGNSPGLPGQGQPVMRQDSIKRDSTQVRPDSTTIRPDSSTVRPDSTARPALPATPIKQDSTALPVKPATPADSTKKE